MTMEDIKELIKGLFTKQIEAMGMNKDPTIPELLGEIAAEFNKMKGKLEYIEYKNDEPKLLFRERITFPKSLGVKSLVSYY